MRDSNYWKSEAAKGTILWSCLLMDNNKGVADTALAEKYDTSVNVIKELRERCLLEDPKRLTIVDMFIQEEIQTLRNFMTQCQRNIGNSREYNARRTLSEWLEEYHEWTNRLTNLKLRQACRDAYNEGHDEGYEDGYDLGRDKGYNEGYEDGYISGSGTSEDE